MLEKIVIVDKGHDDTIGEGASSGGLVERVLNVRIGDRVISTLENKYHFKVYSFGGKLETRYAKYNKYIKSNKYLAFSIHHNGLDNPSANGTEVLISVFANDKMLGFAHKTLTKIIETLKTTNRGIVRRKNSEGTDYYGFIRELMASCIIVEPLFLSNPNNRNLILKNVDEYIILMSNLYVSLILIWYEIKEITLQERIEEIQKLLNEINIKFNSLKNNC